MRLMNSEMRKNMSSFDYGEKSLKKYGTQLDGLNKKLELQKTVVESARKNYEKMVEAHGEGSKEAQEAAANYNHEAASLNNLERHIQKVTAEMKEFERQQKIQNTTLFKTGDSLVNFGNGLKSISDKVKGLGETLTKRITLPAMGAASALAGIALVKGFERIVGIDTARAKLLGLGHEAKNVEVIMESALESVKGTAFGLDEAATTASSAVAAGVKEGKELTRYLSLTGDTAAIAGTSLADMGSIFNKVQTAQRAYTGELNQLADRGIPIYQWLAEQVGKSAEEVRDMASDGKISSEMFLQAVEDNIGGAAKKMGEKSFTASVANMWAAVGRLGASFLDAGGKGGGFFSQLKPLITDFTGRVDDMGDVAEKAGVKFGEFFTGIVNKVKSIKSSYDELSPAVQNIINKTAILGSVLAVGLGPALVGLGMFGRTIANISTGLGTFLKFLAPIITPLKGVGAVAAEGGKKVGLLSRAFTFLTGPVGITIGVLTLLATGFTTAYKKSETFRDFIHKLGDTLKEVFGKVMDWIQPGIDAVVEFFRNIKADIANFINGEGSQLMEAFKNIGSFIAVVLGGIWKGVKWVFDQIVSVIKFAMPLIEFIIKMVWGAIKDVISGTLDFILGAVKVFSGIFTGDFGKMWEGLKQMFFGALQAIWGYINLTFFGRIIKGVGSFVMMFRAPLSAMWNFIRNLFSNSVGNVWTFVRNGFTRILDTIRAIITSVRNVLHTTWTNILNTVRNIVSNLWTGIRNTFTRMKDGILNLTTNIRTGIVNRWNLIKDRISTLARDLWHNVRDRFNDMVDGAKKLPGRIGDGIRNAAGSAVKAVKNLGGRMLNTFASPINSVIAGINWVLGKLKLDKIGGEWKVPSIPAYAHGTDGHPGGMAILGDGVGSNKGRELVQTPDGNTFLSPAKPTLTFLPKGTHVLSATDTRSLLGDVPKYAWGTVKKVAGKVKDTVSNVWDHLSNPSKLLDMGLKALGLKAPAGLDFVADIAKGGFKFLKDKAITYLKDAVKNLFGSGAAPTSGGAAAWRPMIIQAAARMGESITEAQIKGIIAQIHRESGGNQAIVQSPSVYDINIARGNPARGLLQYIPQSFRRYAVKGYGNIYSGYDQLLAFFNNTNWRKDLPYGRRGWGPTGKRKFESGGLIKSMGLYQLAEGGYPEWIIPTDPKRRTDAMKLLALAAKDINGNKRPNQLPNVSNQYDDRLLDAILEQNEILLQLLEKDGDVYIDGEKAGKIFAPKVQKHLERAKIRKMRGRGYAT